MNKDDLRKLHAVEDHARDFKNRNYVYPVISRRAGGLSLGVNLNPNRLCTFDCVYCEVDRSAPLSPAAQKSVIDIPLLKEELSWLLKQALSGELGKEPKFAQAGDLLQQVRDVSFSGDGEPTLCPDFPDAVRAVGEVLKEFDLLTTCKVVLITNATCLHLTSVHEALDILMSYPHGEIWAKLDAGTSEYYARMNRSGVPFERILSNLNFISKRIPVYIQSMFLKLNGQMMSEVELLAYMDRIKNLIDSGGKILGIQAYTLARPTFAPGLDSLKLSALTKAELEALGDQIRKNTGLAVECYV
ncbi:MAG: radical SAM protein [Verrucomicrobia bacterium]|jgi:wyosine [tRNA(Phe)-imidazoG37] synthetase (radical SAM superfamily)|nr:radical SAM protein [Verrucomicrobiota bacterium]